MLGSYPCSHKDGNKPLPPTVQTKNLLQQGKQNKHTHINECTVSIFHGFPHFLRPVANFSRVQRAFTLVAVDPTRRYVDKRGSGCTCRDGSTARWAVAHSVEGCLRCAFPFGDKFNFTQSHSEGRNTLSAPSSCKFKC